MKKRKKSIKKRQNCKPVSIEKEIQENNNINSNNAAEQEPEKQEKKQPVESAEPHDLIPDKSGEAKRHQKIGIKQILIFLRKWGIIITVIFFAIKIYFKYTEHQADLLTKESNLYCSSITIDPRATIDKDSFQKIAFDFKYPISRETNDSVYLMYELTPFSTITKRPVDSITKFFKASDVINWANKRINLSNYYIQKRVWFNLTFANIGETAQKETFLEIFLWKKTRWIRSTAIDTETIPEILRHGQLNVAVSTNYNQDEELPTKIYFQIRQAYKTAFNKKRHKNYILVLRVDTMSIYEISEERFKQDTSTATKLNNIDKVL